MMVEISFSSIVDAVKKTISQFSSEYRFKFDVLSDSFLCYRAVLNFNNCMGQIIVNNEEFVPYRFVQIEIISFDSKAFHQVYYWGDGADDDLQSIIHHIKSGIQTGIQY